MPKRSNREMDVEHSGECLDSAAAGGESSGAAAAAGGESSGAAAAAGGESSGATAAGQSTSSGEGPRMSRLSVSFQNKHKSLDRLPWRRDVLDINALSAADIDLLFETDDEDEDESVEFQNDIEDKWLPDNDEASDIEDEIVVKSPDIEDEDEDESREDIPITGEKYIAPDLTEWFTNQLPQGNVPSHNVLRKRGGPHRKFQKPEMKTRDGRKVAKGRCYTCIFNDPKSDRKGRTKCSNCKRTMCATHIKSLPPLCTGPNC